MTTPKYMHSRGARERNPLLMLYQPDIVPTINKYGGDNVKGYASFRGYIYAYTCYMDLLHSSIKKSTMHTAFACVRRFLWRIGKIEDLSEVTYDALAYAGIGTEEVINIFDRKRIVLLLVRLSLIYSKFCPDREWIAAGYDMYVSGIGVNG